MLISSENFSVIFMIIHSFLVCAQIIQNHQLEATTNYDERRKIRARLRQVMADQEGNDRNRSNPSNHSVSQF